MAREIDEITGIIVDAAMKLHTQLGPGLLESVYQMVLTRDLERRGLTVEPQKPVVESSISRWVCSSILAEQPSRKGSIESSTTMSHHPPRLRVSA